MVRSNVTRMGACDRGTLSCIVELEMEGRICM